MIASSNAPSKQAWCPRGELDAGTAEAVAGFLDRLRQRHMAVDSLQIFSRGELVVDHYSWPYRAEVPRMLHSATKSFVGTAMGFALAEQLLSLDQKLVDLLPEWRPEAGSALEQITIEDLLTMRTGHRVGPSGATWRRLETSWVEHYFSLPVEDAPGERFIYSSASSHMLSAILQRVTGVPVSEYLRTRLFEPLGFGPLSWSTDPEGICSGGNGLSIRMEDFLKWGVLHLRNGAWNGEQLLPAGWVSEATLPRVADASLRWNGEGFESADASEFAGRTPQGYGYHLWTTANNAYFASGIFGQLCLVSPQDDTVIVVSAGMPDELGSELLTEVTTHLLPHLAARPGSATGSVLNGELADACAALTAPATFARNAEPHVLSDTYFCDPNEDGITEITLITSGEPGSTKLVIEFRDARGHHVIHCGVERWLESETTATGWRLHHSYQPEQATVVAAASWISRTTLVLWWNFIESPFRDVVVIQWSAPDRIQWSRSSNVNSGFTARPSLTAQSSPRS